MACAAIPAAPYGAWIEKLDPLAIWNFWLNWDMPYGKQIPKLDALTIWHGVPRHGKQIQKSDPLAIWHVWNDPYGISNLINTCHMASRSKNRIHSLYGMWLVIRECHIVSGSNVYIHSPLHVSTMPRVPYGKRIQFPNTLVIWQVLGHLGHAIQRANHNLHVPYDIITAMNLHMPYGSKNPMCFPYDISSLIQTCHMVSTSKNRMCSPYGMCEFIPKHAI